MKDGTVEDFAIGEFVGLSSIIGYPITSAMPAPSVSKLTVPRGASRILRGARVPEETRLGRKLRPRLVERLASS